MMAALNPSSYRGVLRQNEPMAKHTTWRVGGLAEDFFEPADIDDLAKFLRQLPTTQAVFWLGLGSNILVREGGIDGVVICTSGTLMGMQQQENRTLRVEAGVPCAKVARYAVKHNLIGGEFFIGIPGTMGGALAMNAGAFGGETWQLVAAVETLNRQGERHLRLPAEYQVGYRHVESPALNEWFVAAHLKLETGDSAKSAAQIKILLERRNQTQPTGQHSCGSVFKNPPGDFAARLIESCGLKNYCMGGACVSEKHANFIINTGAATATEIERLIVHVQEAVKRLTGVTLIPEVRIVGKQPEELKDHG